ncbi:MAG: FHA domain-containing serine/threonine-protein kinase [Planctomycetaceae bacterium]
MNEVSVTFLDSLAQSRVLPDPNWIDRVRNSLEQQSVELLADDRFIAQELVRRRLLTPFQANELLEGRGRQLRIGPYILTDQIGIGGMGTVYAARHEETGSTVAIKVLAPQLKQDAGMRARFRLEATAGQRVRHAGLVATYGIGLTDDVFGEVDYMVMEHFPGLALNELTALNGPVLWSAACDMVCQSAAALGCLHRDGMVHRDVKPENLLVDGGGRIKLIDFGLALLEAPGSLAADGSQGDEFSLTMLFGHDCLGTVDYMAPEQSLDGQSADQRSDIYSLGCTFFVLLSGRRPYTGNDRKQIRDAHRTLPTPRLDHLAPKVPQSVIDLVARMMAKDPADRPASMDEVILALAPFAIRQPIRFDYQKLIDARLAAVRKKSGVHATSTATTGSRAKSSAIASRDSQLQSLRRTAIASETEKPVSDPSMPTLPPPTRRVMQDSAAEIAAQIVASCHQCTAAPPAQLHQADGTCIPLTPPRLTIGRHRQNHLPLDVADLSSHHCELSLVDGHWIIRDTNSKNGLFINDTRVREHRLRPGDKIRLASRTTFRFEQVTSATGLPAAQPATEQSQGSSHRVLIAAVIALVATLSAVAWYALAR